MKNKNYFLFLIVTLLFLFNSIPTQAANIPTSQQASGIEATRRLEEKDQKLRERIQKERVSPAVENVSQEESKPVPDGETVLVSKIEVSGATLLSSVGVRKEIGQYENKQISMRDMQEVANRITDAYRQKGFITSRAVLPPQKIENGILKIQVIEGRMGQLDVEGNKYFRTSLIRKRIDLKPGDPFDYNKLKKNLASLNQVQDRKVQTVLKPGKDNGTTDLVLNVKDSLPIHAGVSFDNYGSRYLRKNRYQGTLTHNNLLGFDDILNLTYQIAEGHNTYRLESLRYLFPITSATQIGFYASNSQVQLGREYKDLDARGKTKIYSVFFNHSLLANDIWDISVNGGLDYKDVFNFQVESETSRDILRVGKLGLKVDKSDSMGRTIINNEVDQGFPRLWGSLNSKEDTRSSRRGAGGLFTKDVLDVIRLQRMPWESTLLLKGQAQYASHTLTATEQFQLGGIANVRAYPPGEAAGDTGYSTTAELSFPVYGISKSIQAPFSKAKLYDALRLATFYDWGRTGVRTVALAERENKSLGGYGCGIRYDLPENFSLRVDVAWPAIQHSSDNRHVQTWVKVSKDF